MQSKLHSAYRFRLQGCSLITGFFPEKQRKTTSSMIVGIGSFPLFWRVSPAVGLLIITMFSVARQFNFRADFLAKLALRLLNRNNTFGCLCTSSTSGMCPMSDALPDQAFLPIILISVKCCWSIYISQLKQKTYCST